MSKTRKTSPPAPVARMTLVEISERQKILAGHDDASESTVYVLRKTDAGDWHLYCVPITDLDATLRSFIPADESEHMELAKAIEATMTKPRRKPRRKAK
ncbi:hypothetical protein [Stieleria mannarensis]|uniref:hypothetical protein n=1 Tax=Stieleria mannarensis TaxID=2755585 RepID=UPI0016010E2A|nr:hypothetical protein [Rhodopirellula sp. JC639]